MSITEIAVDTDVDDDVDTDYRCHCGCWVWDSFAACEACDYCDRHCDCGDEHGYQHGYNAFDFAPGTRAAFENDRSTGWWYLHSVKVDEDKRGQGLGTKLMQHVVTKIEEAEADVSLHCRPRHIAWYASFGFEDCGVVDPYHDDERTAPMYDLHQKFSEGVHLMVRPFKK